MAITILHVDDDQAILNVFQQILLERGYTVLSASDATLGLELFKSKRPDIVLLDHYMEGMDGAVLALLLKQHNPQIPIIMLSGSAIPDHVREIVDGFLLKGSGIPTLVDSIEAAIESRPAQWPSLSDKPAA